MTQPVKSEGILKRLSSTFRVIGTEEEVQAQARAEHERRQLGLLGNRLADWGVGALERRVVLQPNVLPTPAVQAVAAFLNQPTLLTLVLWGPAGDGKSVAAARWLGRAARRPLVTAELGASWEWDPRTRFAPVFELEAKARSWQPQDKAWMADVMACRALVLDDLGAETGDIRGPLTALVYERCRQQRLTVITTNLAPPALTAKYEARNLDRILQAGRLIDCGPNNLRLPTKP